MTDFIDNLLGAASLSIVDRITAAADETLGLGGQAAGALVMLDMRPGISIKQLAERLHLSHPGAVRLVDRLVEAAWVRRDGSEDRRAVQLNLTAEGLLQAQRLHRARGAQLAAITATLSPAQRDALAPVLAALLSQLTTNLVDAYANCRWCDTAVCEARGCPVNAKAHTLIARKENTHGTQHL